MDESQLPLNSREIDNAHNSLIENLDKVFLDQGRDTRDFKRGRDSDLGNIFKAVQELKDKDQFTEQEKSNIKSAIREELKRTSQESGNAYRNTRIKFSDVIRLIQTADLTEDFFDDNASDTKEIQDGLSILMYSEIQNEGFSATLVPSGYDAYSRIETKVYWATDFINTYTQAEKMGFKFNTEVEITEIQTQGEVSLTIEQAVNNSFANSFRNAISGGVLGENEFSKSDYLNTVFEQQLKVLRAIKIEPRLEDDRLDHSKYSFDVMKYEDTDIFSQDSAIVVTTNDLARIVLVEKFNLDSSFYQKLSRGSSDAPLVLDFDWLIGKLSNQKDALSIHYTGFEALSNVFEEWDIKIDSQNSKDKLVKAITHQIQYDLSKNRLLDLTGMRIQRLAGYRGFGQYMGEVSQDQELKTRLKEKMQNSLEDIGITFLSDYDQRKGYEALINTFKLEDDFKDILINNLNFGTSTDADTIRSVMFILGQFGVPRDEVRVQQKVRKEIDILLRFSSGDFREIAELCRSFHLDSGFTKKTALRCVLQSVADNRKQAEVFSSFGIFNYELTLDELRDQFVSVKSFTDNWQINDLNELNGFIKEEPEFWEHIARYPAEEVLITKEDLPQIRQFHITLIEAEQLKGHSDYLNDVYDIYQYSHELAKTDKKKAAEVRERVFKTLYEHLQEVSTTDWNQWIVQKPFAEGAAIFGYEGMFAYIDRKGLSRHNALHAFEPVIQTLYGIRTASDDKLLTAEQFYGNILFQVAKDDQTYIEGSAQEHLNAIARTFNPDVQSTIDTLKKYKDIEQVAQFAEYFHAPEVVFASWNNLKKFVQVSEFLEKSEMLDELAELKKQGKEDLYQYVSKLAFHPSSKVDMEAVKKFWRDPEGFLGEDASHTPADVHDRKKPSNYTVIPNLDLDAVQLRDALVEGALDKIQAFTPMEITYDFVAIDGILLTRQVDVVRAALGSRRNGIQGHAENPNRLFAKVKEIVGKYGVKVEDYLAESAEIPPTAIEELNEHLFNGQYGLSKNSHERYIITAQISKKSDPDAVLAGNDTACCMPFGDGKNTVYMFNLNTAHFTVQLTNSEGTARTIAQSVLTKDQDIKMPIPQVLSEMEGGHVRLDQVLPDSVLDQNAPRFINPDNVEVASSYKDGIYAEMILEVYKDFFKEYTTRFGSEQRLSTDRMFIGREGYEGSFKHYLTGHLPRTKNTFAPQAPVSYSDKVSEDVYYVNFNSVTRIDRKIVTVENQTPQASPGADLPKGVAPLTFEDSIAVAYLEGKAYADNMSLVQYLHNMENGLIAKDINNAAKDRPNMSVKYSDENGKMRGYMFAYEGRINITGGRRQQSRYDDDIYGYEDDYDNDEPTPVVYIADLATDTESRAAWGRLIRGFEALYDQYYLQTDNPIGIYMEARERTSYHTLQGRLNKAAENYGVTFEVQELGEYQTGEQSQDTMHRILLQPVALAA